METLEHCVKSIQISYIVLVFPFLNLNKKIQVGDYQLAAFEIFIKNLWSAWYANPYQKHKGKLQITWIKHMQLSKELDEIIKY